MFSHLYYFEKNIIIVKGAVLNLQGCKKIENNNLYTYYHFILENNGNDDQRFGVWANGILTETTSKNHFMNHKYILL